MAHNVMYCVSFLNDEQIVECEKWGSHGGLLNIQVSETVLGVVW